MLGTGTRFFYALAVLGLIGAGVYGLTTGGQPIGVISMGYKGGVGEHFGYTVLTFFAATSLVLGVVGTVLRDTDPSVVAGSVPGGVLPQADAPNAFNPWPAIAVVGAVIALIGLITGWLLFVVGLVIIGITVVEWAVRAWADKATGDPEVNQALRDRFLAPIEIPVASFLVLGFIVVGLSRVFLAVSSTAAWVIGTALLGVVILAAVLVLTRPQQSKTVAKILLVIGAIGVIAGGITGVAVGTRDFHHEEEPAHEEAE